MKRIFLLLVTVPLICTVTAQKYQGSSWASIKDGSSNTLSVVYYEQAGLIQETNGKPEGLCVDVLQDFVAFVELKYKKKIEIKYLGKEPVFSEFLLAAQNNNNVLGVTNVTITDERKKNLKFTPPFMSNPVVLITHKDAPTVANFSEIASKLEGYSAEIIAGSTHVKHINKIKRDNWPNLTIQYGPSGQEIIKKLTATSKLFTILDFTEFVDATRKRLPVKKQDLEFGSPEELAFIMSKQSDWDAVWREFLTEEYRKSPKYRKNIAENLGSAFLSILK